MTETFSLTGKSFLARWKVYRDEGAGVHRDSVFFSRAFRDEMTLNHRLS